MEVSNEGNGMSGSVTFNGLGLMNTGIVPPSDIIISKATNGFIVSESFQKHVFTSYGQIAKWLKSKAQSEAHSQV